MTEYSWKCTTQFFMASNQVCSCTINSAGQAQLPEAIGSAAYQPSSALSLHSEQILIILHKNHSFGYNVPTKVPANEILGILQTILVPRFFLKCSGEMLLLPLPCPSLVFS